MSKLTTRVSHLGSQIMHSPFCVQIIIICLLIYNAQKSFKSEIVENPQSILTQALIMVKGVIQHAKQSTSEQFENFQAGLPGFFAQDVLPFGIMNYQDIHKSLWCQENQGINPLRSFYTPQVVQTKTKVNSLVQGTFRGLSEFNRSLKTSSCYILFLFQPPVSIAAPGIPGDNESIKKEQLPCIRYAPHTEGQLPTLARCHLQADTSQADFQSMFHSCSRVTAPGIVWYLIGPRSVVIGAHCISFSVK